MREQNPACSSRKEATKESLASKQRLKREEKNRLYKINTETYCAHAQKLNPILQLRH